LVWLPGLMPAPERPQPTIWGYEHLTDDDLNRVRAVQDARGAKELAEELVLIRVMQRRPPWRRNSPRLQGRRGLLRLGPISHTHALLPPANAREPECRMSRCSYVKEKLL